MNTITIVTKELTCIIIKNADVTCLTNEKVVFYVENIRFEVYMENVDHVEVMKNK